MTYCVGVLVEQGLVLIADTRTNAGLDDISTYRKLTTIAVRVADSRIGQCWQSGSVPIGVGSLTEGLRNDETGEARRSRRSRRCFRRQC